MPYKQPCEGYVQGPGFAVVVVIVAVGTEDEVVEIEVKEDREEVEDLALLVEVETDVFEVADVGELVGVVFSVVVERDEDDKIDEERKDDDFDVANVDSRVEVVEVVMVVAVVATQAMYVFCTWSSGFRLTHWPDASGQYPAPGPNAPRH